MVLWLTWPLRLDKHDSMVDTVMVAMIIVVIMYVAMTDPPAVEGALLVAHVHLVGPLAGAPVGAAGGSSQRSLYLYCLIVLSLIFNIITLYKKSILSTKVLTNMFGQALVLGSGINILHRKFCCAQFHLCYNIL